MARTERFIFESCSDERIDALLTNPSFKESYNKWGLHHNTNLKAFRFSSGDTDGMATVHASGCLRPIGFRRGLLDEFLCSLFGSKIVQESMGFRVLMNKDLLHLRGDVEYTELRCRWTSLEPFRRLSDKGIVRQVEDDDAESFDGARFPTVKIADFYLPHDVGITDALRALFLLAHNCAASVDDEWGNEYGMYGAQISLNSLRDVFSEEERNEFLYHIIWRFIAGGGTMNQWDDDFGVYLSAAREWYKSMVTIRAIRRCGDVEDTGDAAAPVEPEVLSTVVQIHAVKGLELFTRTDDADPSNLNYCYVVIDPLESVLLMWHHRF